MKKIVILDLSKDIDLLVKDSEVFQLSSGITKLERCKIVRKKFYSEKNFQIFTKEINNLFINFYKNLKVGKSNQSYLCLEIFNQRNDKTQIYNKIYYLNQVLKYIKFRDFQKIEIVTDDSTFLNSYKSIKSKRIKIIDISTKTEFTYRKYFSKTLFFHIKALLVVSLAKLINKQKFQNKKKLEGCLSIFPLFYKENKHKFYNNNFLNFNFQLTDETHLGNSLFKNLKTIFNINKINNTLSVESFVRIRNILFNFFQSLKGYKLIRKTNLYNFEINTINYSDQFRSLFFNSLLNLNKLNIYQSAFDQIFDRYTIKKFHLYLFEYNFGYFLSHMIKKKSPKTILIGYQHGIYSERLMWQNFSKKINLSNYYPDLIICKYFFSFDAYKNNFKNIPIKLLDKKKVIKELKKETIKVSQYNVYLGLHDCYNIINELRNLGNVIKFKLILHPKMKYKNILNIGKNFKFNFNSLKKKQATLVSSTSTMPYQLYSKEKYNIVAPKNIIPLNPKSLDHKILKI